MRCLDPRLPELSVPGMHEVVTESRDTCDVSGRWEMDDPVVVVVVLKEHGFPHADTTTRPDGLRWAETHNAVYTVAGRTV